MKHKQRYKCITCQRVLNPGKDNHVKVKITSGLQIVLRHYHVECYGMVLQKYGSTNGKVIEMEVTKRFFIKEDGTSSPILRLKKDEDETTGVERLGKMGWNLAKGSYHLVDTPDGKAFHVAKEPTCKYCHPELLEEKSKKSGEVSAPDTAATKTPKKPKAIKVKDKKKSEAKAK